MHQVRAVGQGAAGHPPHHRRRGGRARVARAQRGGSVGRDHREGAHGMHRAATWGCMAWGCSPGMRGAVVTRGCVSPGQVRANPRFGKLLQRGLCRQDTSAPPPHAPPPQAPPPRLHGRAALLAGVAPSGAGARQEIGVRRRGGGLTDSRLARRTDGRTTSTRSPGRCDLPGGAISREVRSPGAQARADLAEKLDTMYSSCQARADLPEERARRQAQP